MPIDLAKALGAELTPTTFNWDEDRVILYHLGLGAGREATADQELALTYEAKLKVLPTFATIPPFHALLGMSSVEGIEFNPAVLLHGEHEIEVAAPISTRGTVTNHGKVVEVWDKGKGALVVVEVVSTDAAGVHLFTNRASLYLRGEGGFGGEPGPAASNQSPDRPPDLIVESPTLPQQALLYRLSGDKNPLHADPAFAAFAGFDRPILHGLCTFGIVAKAVVDQALGGEVGLMKRYRARFSGVVYPGETIVTRIWIEPDRLLVAADVADRGSSVIANAAVWS